MQLTSSFPDQQIELAGTSVHYVESGKGKLVLLVHGSLCDYRYWRWQMDSFSEHFRVIAPSLPGCWPDAISPDSASPTRVGAAVSSLGPFGLQQHVRAIVELCERFAPTGRVHLVGHSRGAQVALEAALAIPHRIGGLVLADPGFSFTDEANELSRHAGLAGRLGNAPLDEVISEFVDAVNGEGTWRRTVSWFKDMVRANAWTLLPQRQDSRHRIDPQHLEDLGCGVLLVGGELSPSRYGDRIARLIDILPTEQTQHIVVPRSAHGMNLANARYFNDAVLQFLLQH